MTKKLVAWSLVAALVLFVSNLLFQLYFTMRKSYDPDASAIPIARLQKHLASGGVDCRVERGIYFDNDAWELIVIGQLDRVGGSAEKAALVRGGEIYDFGGGRGSVTAVNLGNDRALIAYSRYHSFHDMSEFLPKFREGWEKARSDELAGSK